jgi:hypothetical protein
MGALYFGGAAWHLVQCSLRICATSQGALPLVKLVFALSVPPGASPMLPMVSLRLAPALLLAGWLLFASRRLSAGGVEVIAPGVEPPPPALHPTSSGTTDKAIPVTLLADIILLISPRELTGLAVDPAK